MISEEGQIKEDPKKRPIEEVTKETKPQKKSKRKPHSTGIDQELYIKKSIRQETKNLDIANAVALWEAVILHHICLTQPYRKVSVPKILLTTFKRSSDIIIQQTRQLY